MIQSAFEMIGPSMIGPSSSHTAGAARLGWVAHHLAGGAPSVVRIGLHGSFAATGKGHATDRGIIAGLLGYASDDERLKDSLEIARQKGMSFFFETIDLGEKAHPNSARLILSSPSMRELTLEGSSIGGGSIVVTSLNGFDVSLTGSQDTLVIFHRDRSGFLAQITSVLACVNLNIATIRTVRRHRGTEAITVIETDGPPPSDALSVMQRIQGVEFLRTVPKLV